MLCHHVLQQEPITPPSDNDTNKEISSFDEEEEAAERRNHERMVLNQRTRNMQISHDTTLMEESNCLLMATERQRVAEILAEMEAEAPTTCHAQ
jgi:hypothetical protein